MKFSASQIFDVPCAAVLAAYSSPDTWANLPEFERVKIVDVLDSQGSPDRPIIRVRYRFTADLPSAARAIIDPDQLTWVEATEYDLEAGSASVRFFPDRYGSKLAASAQCTFANGPAGSGDSTRTVRGDLRVKVLLVGGQVEGAIVSGLKEHLVEEQIAIQRLLRLDPPL